MTNSSPVVSSSSSARPDSGVAQNIAQRFLRHPIQSVFDRGAEAPGLASGKQLNVQSDLRQVAQVRVERRPQAEVLEHCWAEVTAQATYAVAGAIDEIVDRIDASLGPISIRKIQLEQV